MSLDEIIKNGLLAHKRKQQRITDKEDRKKLYDEIKKAGPNGIVLDERYNIRLRIWENAPPGWGGNDFQDED